MARTIFFDGPKPPGEHVWCAVCVMLVKMAGVSAYQDQVDEASRGDASEPPVRVDISDVARGMELEVAVTRTISASVPNFGPLDVCWSHAMALQLMPNGLAPASPQEAAMLNQAARLGGPRR